MTSVSVRYGLEHTYIRDHVSTFGLFVITATLVRVFVLGSILDLFMPYTATGGFILAKISPGSYLLLAAAAWAMLRRPPPLDTGVVAALVLASTAVIGLALAFLSKTSSAGFLIDAVLAASACAYAVSALTPHERLILARSLLIGLVCNAGLLAFEFATHVRLLPYPYREELFRPTGLLSHPLLNGLFYAVSIPLAFVVGRTLLTRRLYAGVFLVATFISGARTASIVAAAVFVASLFLAFLRERRVTALVYLLLVALLSPLFVMLGQASGLGYRLQNSLFDNSARTRINIYQLLKYLGPGSMWRGVGMDTLSDWSLRVLHERSVESSIVVAIFMFGAAFACIYLLMMLATMATAAWSSSWLGRLAVATFLVISATNNCLVSKDPALVFLVAAIFSVRDLKAEDRRRA
jgi:hypothetical protein